MRLLLVPMILSSYFAIAETAENRSVTKAMTNIEINQKGYIVIWRVDLWARPDEPNVFKECGAKIREAIEGRLSRVAEERHVIGIQSDWIAVSCARHEIGFEARPEIIKED